MALPVCDPAADPVSTALVNRYRSLVVWRPDDGGPVEAAAIPTEAERRKLLVRCHALDATLRQASETAEDTARVAVAVSVMLGAGGYASLQNVDREAKVAEYTWVLRDLPAWAVERGCDKVQRGKVKEVNPDWPPTGPRLHQVCEAEIASVKAEQHAIEQVLKLQPPHAPTEAERERKAFAAQAWLDRTDPKAQRLNEIAVDEPARREAAERTKQCLIEGGRAMIEAEYRAAGLEPIRSGDGSLVSLSLAKALGTRPAKEEAA